MLLVTKIVCLVKNGLMLKHVYVIPIIFVGQ